MSSSFTGFDALWLLLWEYLKDTVLWELPNTGSEQTTKVTQAIQILTKILWRSLQKRRIGLCFVLREGRVHWEDLLNWRVLLVLQVVWVIDHPNWLKAFWIITFNFQRFLPKPCIYCGYSLLSWRLRLHAKAAHSSQICFRTNFAALQPPFGSASNCHHKRSKIVFSFNPRPM